MNDLTDFLDQKKSVYPDIQAISPNRLIPYYLMSSYLYYKKDKSVLSDGDYDLMCKRMLNKWNSIKHPHKKLVNKNALEAGTGYDIRKYPTITMRAAELWYSDWEKTNEIS